MRVIALIAACVACTTAETFFWNKFNNFNEITNWEVAGEVCTGNEKTDPLECPFIDAKSISFSGPLMIKDQSACTGPGESVVTSAVGVSIALSTVRDAATCGACSIFHLRAW